jgi:UPF0271 protein
MANAIKSDILDVKEQTQSLVTGSALSTMNGKSIQLQCETICIHSDTPNAIEFAKAIYQIVNF